MRKHFADTSHFIALLVEHDEAHAIATALANQPSVEVITTDYVIVEVAAFLGKPNLRGACIALIDDLRTSGAFTVIRSAPRLFDEGWQLYRSHQDKSWSLTDCISFVVMRQRKIKDALTTDHHFEQAGFRALLKETAT
jgi:uncharacterized protein